MCEVPQTLKYKPENNTNLIMRPETHVLVHNDSVVSYFTVNFCKLLILPLIYIDSCAYLCVSIHYSQLFLMQKCLQPFSFSFKSCSSCRGCYASINLILDVVICISFFLVRCLYKDKNLFLTTLMHDIVLSFIGCEK